MRTMQLLLAGVWQDGEDTIVVRSPFNGAEVARVARAGQMQIQRAAQAAADARQTMAALPPAERAAILECTRAGVIARRDEIAQAIVEEGGKPLALARVEATRMADVFQAAAEVARNPSVLGQDLSGFPSGVGRLALVRRVPIGPVLGITPFNFPAMLVAHKLAPAVAAACPIVLKPASQTPSGALLLGEILLSAGLPPQALSILPARPADIEPLVGDPRFRLITFTGSGAVGWGIKKKAWNTRVALELGGNAAVIVEPDAGNLREVAERIAGAAFGNAGQSCISVQRVLIARAVYDQMRVELVAAAQTTMAGDPRDERTVCGPLIDSASAERVVSWIERAVAAGGTLLCGGARVGNVVAPALLENVPPEQPIVADEVFGPVAVLSAYDDFEQALVEVNHSRYGLQAGIWTRDIGKVRRAWDVLEVGGVIQGDVPTWRCDPMPYGGVKESGVGREGPLYAVIEMTEERLLVLR
jgi:acyl-CoA reductase-like NAD-dependent aldehyde dehydrogenase